MGCIRPATPGFLLTTLAAALLAVVSFCVPWFKSVFFLKADITQDGISGSITFGTLGYCVDISGTTTCSKPTIGYELDINSLVGNKLPIEIPNAVVKWLTYALVLHIVALVLAVGAAIFGLLAHVREMSMTCCSTCISGFAAAVALIAFVFDLALFFIAKSRINSVGKASIGNAIWLTLAAWILLFFSGCFYTLGRCCLSNRKRGDWDGRREPPALGDNTEQLRLDAVRAEAERKAQQKAHEGGLPAFHERQPLTTTAYDDGNNVYADKPNTPTAGGYMKAPTGTRAVDQYYNNANPSGGYSNTSSPYNSSAGANAYPPSRQNYAPSAYAPSTYSYNAPPQQPQNPYPNQQYQSTPPQQPYRATSPPQQTLSPPAQQYGLGAAAALGAVRTASPAQKAQPNPYLDPNPNPYLGHAGHPSRGTSYHSAATHAGEYSQYDPYESGAHSGSEYYPAQNHTQGAYGQSQYGTPQGQSQYSPHEYDYGGEQHHQQQDVHAHDDAYGGYGDDGYGANSVPPLDTSGGYFPQATASASSSHSPTRTSPTSPRGPKSHGQSLHTTNRVTEDDSPPGYEQGSEHVPGAWGKS